MQEVLAEFKIISDHLCGLQSDQAYLKNIPLIIDTITEIILKVSYKRKTFVLLLLSTEYLLCKKIVKNLIDILINLKYTYDEVILDLTPDC